MTRRARFPEDTSSAHEKMELLAKFDTEEKIAYGFHVVVEAGGSPPHELYMANLQLLPSGRGFILLAGTRHPPMTAYANGSVNVCVDTVNSTWYVPRTWRFPDDEYANK